MIPESLSKLAALGLLGVSCALVGLGVGVYIGTQGPALIDNSPCPIATSSQTHTVTVTRPDGSSTTTSTTTSSIAAATIKRNDYRLGINYVHSFREDAPPSSFEIQGGIRLGRTPLFLQSSVNPLIPYVTLGVGIEF